MSRSGIPSARSPFHEWVEPFPGSRLREAGGCSAQDLVLLLQQPLAALQLPQLRGLGGGHAGPVTVLHVSAVESVARTTR
jgi:hypothetical protein